MIETVDLAERIESDLNRMLPAGSDLAFKIWANVGEHKPPERNGNKVKYTIEGHIKTTASAMEANKVIAIGVNSFSLEIMIPLRVPLTSLGQDIAQLQTVQNGQYVFPAFVIGILSQYFKGYKSWEITKTEGGVENKYAVGIMGGVALPGDVDIRAFFGSSLPVSVYITANIVQGGTVSTDVTVKINDSIIPAQIITPSRTAVLNNDVLSGSLASKSVATSSAFAIQVQFPTSAHAGTEEALDFLINGNINRAYFVEIRWGNHATKNAFMLMARCNGAAEGVTIAGLTAELTEVVHYSELICVPERYQVGKFILNSSQVQSISVTMSGADKVNAYIGGEALVLRNGTTDIRITPDDIVDEGSTYAVYLITSRKCTISGAYPFEIVKAGA